MSLISASADRRVVTRVGIGKRLEQSLDAVRSHPTSSWTARLATKSSSSRIALVSRPMTSSLAVPAFVVVEQLIEGCNVVLGDRLLGGLVDEGVGHHAGAALLSPAPAEPHRKDREFPSRRKPAQPVGDWFRLIALEQDHDRGRPYPVLRIRQRLDHRLLSHSWPQVAQGVDRGHARSEYPDRPRRHRGRS